MSRYTYFAYCPKTGLTKIGKSASPRTRVKRLAPKTSLFAVVPESDLKEADAHAMFADFRKNGEWFEVGIFGTFQILRANKIKYMLAKQFTAPDVANYDYAGVRPGGAVSINMPETLLNDLRAMADREHRNLSSFIRLTLEKHVEAQAAKSQPQPEEATA